jgi:hypothetical protein
MKKSDVDSILLMNKFLTVHEKNKGCCYFIKKIIDTKIKTTITKKPSFLLPFLILGFIFAGRSGLWS